MSIVDDFKSIKQAARLLNGGDDHYSVAQPMAVNTEITGQVILDPGHTHPVPVDNESSIDYSHVYGDFSGLTGQDGRAWTYNSYEDRWEHRPADGSLIVSFVRPDGN
jgi:hypothetical protein